MQEYIIEIWHLISVSLNIKRAPPIKSLIHTYAHDAREIDRRSVYFRLNVNLCVLSVSGRLGLCLYSNGICVSATFNHKMLNVQMNQKNHSRVRSSRIGRRKKLTTEKRESRSYTDPHIHEMKYTRTQRTCWN